MLEDLLDHKVDVDGDQQSVDEEEAPAKYIRVLRIFRVIAKQQQMMDA